MICQTLDNVYLTYVSGPRSSNLAIAPSMLIRVPNIRDRIVWISYPMWRL